MSRERYFGNVFNIHNSRGDLVASIDEKTVDKTSTSLVLHGRGYSPYGLARNENYVRLIENFSGTAPPLRPIDGQLWWKQNEALYVFDTAIGSPSWRTIVPPSTGIGFSVTPGDGFDQTSGGLPIGSPLEVLIDLGEGRGIQLGADTVGTNASEILHDDLLNFVANEHLDHAAIFLIGGAGITAGSPAISSNVELNIGAGRGITINTGNVSIDDAVVMRTSGSQTLTVTKDFTSQMRGAQSGTSAAVPAFAFSNDSNTGWYRSTTNQLSFTTGAVQRFRIESGGVLRSLNSAYETLVQDDQDIPNKKYVDDVMAAGGNPTVNTHIGVSFISGLLTNTKYLVNIYGRTPNKGRSRFTLESIVLRRGSTTPGLGTIVASTPSVPFPNFNWHDGSAATGVSFICDTNSDTTINAVTNAPWFTSYENHNGHATYMAAIQISE